MTCDWESTTIQRTPTTAIAIGMVKTNAPMPASARTRMASSVAYAEEEMLSEPRMARPVTTERRSDPSASLSRRSPTRTRRIAS